MGRVRVSIGQHMVPSPVFLSISFSNVNPASRQSTASLTFLRSVTPLSSAEAPAVNLLQSQRALRDRPFFTSIQLHSLLVVAYFLRIITLHLPIEAVGAATICKIISILDINRRINRNKHR